MKTNTLPPNIIKLLRGERGYIGQLQSLADLAVDIYQDGKAGRACVPTEAPGFPPHIVVTVERFLLACWEQGRRDAKGVLV